LTGCTPDGAPVTWFMGLALVTASSEARLMLLAGMAAVQHGSTATHRDAGGLAGTREDGDLRGWTRVDVLPPDGMQEVSGSSLLSSTGQKRNSNGSNSEYSSKVQQRRPTGPPYVCSDRAPSAAWGCWQDTGFQALNQRWPACHLGKSPPHRSGDSCHLATTQPPWRTIPASDSCRICKWPRSRWASRPVRFTPGNRASGPGRRVRRRQPRGAGAARGADGVSPALGPLMRCATQAQRCAVAQLFARASARWCVT
jgi:hypothetical protein